MAKPLHAALSPLNITKGDPLLTLKFDSHKTATEVKVQLVEMDEGITAEKGTDDIIAIFEGKIEDYKFKGRLIRKASPPKGAPSFKFQFEDDSQQYDLLIPSGRGEDEKGAYEIGVKVSRYAGRDRRKRKLYEEFISPAPAYIRNLPAANQVAQQRPVIVLLAGGEDGGFYSAAKQFWEPVSDRLEIKGSLEEVIDFLNNNSTEKTKDGMELGAWGDVNIVTHANEDGWAQIALFSGEGPGVNGKAMEQNLRDPRLAIKTKNVDDKTRIIFRGCNVGKSKRFLNAARKLFGGKANVCGPKFIQVYTWESTENITHGWEYFEENFNFYVPWPKTRGWSKPRLPSDKEILRRLKEKYADKADDKEWAKLIKSGRHDSTSPWQSSFSYTKAYTGYKTATSYKELLKTYKDDLRSDIKAALTAEDGRGSFEDYYWSIQPPQKQEDEGAYNVKAVGTRYRIEVRRKLLGPDGKPAVPALGNPDHYGNAD